MAREQPVICHVLHQLYLAGAEVLAAGLARKLSDRYRFIFACLDDLGPLGDRLRNEGFEVVVLHRQPGVDWTVSKHLRQVCRQHHVSLLHAHQYSPFFYAANSRGILGRLRSKPPILFTEHGRHYPDYRRPKRVWANKLLLAKHDRVTAVGQFIKQALIDNEGIPESRIEVIHNGIDAARFRSAAGEDKAAANKMRKETREELGFAADTPVVLHVARMHPVKDHITGLAAMSHVIRTIPDAMLLLAGDGVDRRRLEAKADEFGLKDNVRFLGVREDIPRLMAATDVSMLCSVSEGISVTLLEAMAAGKPIVATDVGGNGEVVGHGSAGFLSKRGDSTELGKNLASLLRNPALQIKMGRAGRDRVIKQFSQELMHAAYARRYDQMLKRVM
jgi:glycosyltransferase involved in cell wall biosynthesis